MTIAGAIRGGTERLSATSNTARLDAELLMAHCLGVTRSDLLLRHMRDDVPADFDALVERRSTSEPIAYIIGKQEFFGHEFVVSPAVLIPRADSETLVEAALELAQGKTGRVLDMGTGSGALLLAFLVERQGWQGVGVDQSSDALEVATQNTEKMQLLDRVQWHQQDWTKPGWSDELGRFDLILCNPPYVEREAELDPDVRNFEPASALFAGEDGGDDYRIIIPQLSNILSQMGCAILEIGANQAEMVTQIAQECGFYSETRQDLANRDRIVIFRQAK